MRLYVHAFQKFFPIQGILNYDFNVVEYDFEKILSLVIERSKPIKHQLSKGSLPQRKAVSVWKILQYKIINQIIAQIFYSEQLSPVKKHPFLYKSLLHTTPASPLNSCLQWTLALRLIQFISCNVQHNICLSSLGNGAFRCTGDFWSKSGLLMLAYLQIFFVFLLFQ